MCQKLGMEVEFKKCSEFQIVAQVQFHYMRRERNAIRAGSKIHYHEKATRPKWCNKKKCIVTWTIEEHHSDTETTAWRIEEHHSDTETTAWRIEEHHSDTDTLQHG
ncbi:hypothetical protein DdX_20669 [Ditylenchus destructor]|uniref:Uncharacterized protein n=1 Tax=Ditylenchus destructor TaxID=166010 RepID=A0AAD4MG00_9BILA|nr:hypothetical protein DdX_20669 [Ditylenchus destructor]